MTGLQAYSLGKNYTNNIVLGLTDITVNGMTITFTIAKTGEKVSMTLPTPNDGVSVTNVHIDNNKHLIVTLSDSNIIDAGLLPIIKGDVGEKGDNGKSAYEIAVENGYSGSKTEWLQSLKGANGNDGVNGSTPTIDDVTGRWFIDGIDTGKQAIGKAGDYNDLINKPEIPTAISELSNDKNFIDATVDNLVNYLKKTETYTKTEVLDLINGISVGLTTKVVSVLPDIQDAEENTIYLVNTGEYSYNQYLLIDGAFANLGSTDINLDDYVTDEKLNTELLQYALSNHTHAELHTHGNKGILDGITSEDIANWGNHFSGDYNDLINTPSIQVVTDEHIGSVAREAVDIDNYYNKTDVDGLLDDKINTDVICTSVDSTSTDEQIPSAKAVFDAVSSGGSNRLIQYGKVTMSLGGQLRITFPRPYKSPPIVVATAGMYTSNLIVSSVSDIVSSSFILHIKLNNDSMAIANSVANWVAIGEEI